MSASRIILASLLFYAKKLPKLVEFDELLTKRNLQSFFF